MTRAITMTATILQFGYAMMLVVVGAAGIVSARWEFAAVYGIDPSAWSLDTQATMLNQYRFLKSVELGAGVFCLAYRKPIMDGGLATTVFLTIVGLGVFARSFAWIIDGRPAAAFIIFLLLETLVFISVVLHLSIKNGSQPH
jgi:Domain of unknown function (DUF4345)